MLFSIFATFSGIVFSIDNAINKRDDGGDNAVLLINMFFFMAGLVSICVRKSKIAGNVAIIILYGITALIGFSTGGTQGQWTIVAVWSTICAAIAAISLYLNIKKSKQSQNTSSNQASIATTTKQCPYCHTEVPSGSAFCGSCGKELPKENICPQCGIIIDDNAQFCSNCGKNLSEHAIENIEQTVDYGEDDESPMKKYLPYILGAIALVAICCGGWWYFNSSKTSQTPNTEAKTDSIVSDSIVTAIEKEVSADSEIADSIMYSNDETNDETIDQDEEETTYEDDNNVSDNPNTCWYIYGTKKELESYKVIKANGINTNLNKDYFTQIGENESKIIKLYSNNARVVSSHPSNSYELSTDDNGKYQLNIILPHEFWSLSKYLVIVVGE